MRFTQNLLVALLLLAESAWSAPPQLIMQGNGRGATACVACHGVDGAGNAQARYPALAGLPETYAIKQLQDFKNTTRTHPIMTPIAQAMSADEATVAARYYAGLPRLNGKSATADALSPGGLLATRGAWDRGVPPCFKCHGIDGSGVAPHFPFLAGQHASYVAAQLQNWKSGARRNDPLNMMKSVADKLTSQEIQALADYLSTLAPLATNGGKK